MLLYFKQSVLVSYGGVTDKTAYVLVFQILLGNETAKIILSCP